MLLILWAAMSTAGFAVWITGHLLGFHGVASIGAVWLMLVGGQVLLDDIQVKTGERIERDYTTIDNSTVENETVVNDTYATQSWTETFASQNAVGIGVFQLLIGVLLFYNQFVAMGEG
jgi:hypothetical protein